LKFPDFTYWGMGEKKSTAVKSWGRRDCGGTFLGKIGGFVAQTEGT
jgi:hypothetical protein